MPIPLKKDRNGQKRYPKELVFIPDKQSTEPLIVGDLKYKSRIG